MCRIDVHARLLILRKNSTLHGLIWVCTFIVFEKEKNPTARLFSCIFIGICPARLLILRKKSPLHGFILVCTFIDFEKKFPPCTSFPSCTFIGNWHVCMNIHHAKSNLKYVLDKYLVIKYKKMSFER